MLQAIAADTIVGGETISSSMHKRILRLKERCGWPTPRCSPPPD